MQSRTTRQFWRRTSRLTLSATLNIHTVSSAPIPGLQFKKLEGEDNIYSVRIGLECRALAVRNRDRIFVVPERLRSAALAILGGPTNGLEG
jgi:hypothetical protein